MKFKQLLVLLLVVTVSLSAQAEQISPEAAAEIAASFVNARPALRKAHKASQTASNMRLAHTRKKAASDENAFYVFNRADNAGFIIVSADDRTAEDVLGYSDGGADFNEAAINPNLRFWLDRYAEEISAIQDNDEAALQPRKAKQVTAIAPLLKNANGVEITWYQEAPYNNYCPIDQLDNTRSLTGCVATAAAQIMYKWRYPAQGIGSSSYTWFNCTSGYDDNGNCTGSGRNVPLSVNYGATTYDWNNMLPSYEGVNYTTAQANAVATLMYHCGVASEMIYGGDEAGGSGTFTDYMAYGLKTYFDYEFEKVIAMHDYDMHDGVPVERNVTTNQFISYFNADLEAGRPIIMGGEGSGGHEFVCDGRDANNKFHINWGWEGSGNGYFAITALKPTGSTYNFSTNLDALIGLRPAAQGPDVNVTWMADGQLFDETVASHGVLALPTATPSACGNGKVFVGWTEDENYSGDDAPEFVEAGTVLDEDAIFYAVYAAEEEGGTASVVATMVAADQGYDNQDDVTSITMNNCTLTFSKGTNTQNGPKYYTSGSAIRCYKNNTLTISSANAITSVVFSTVSSYEGVITASEGSYSNGTWTGSANEVTFTNAPTDNSQWRIVSIQVTTGGGTSYSAYSTSCSGVAPQPVYYTIRFFDNGEQVGEAQSVLKNQLAEVPTVTPACDDYTFVGWWTEGLNSDNTEAKTWVTNFKATKNQDYYAIYSKIVISDGSQAVEESLAFVGLGKDNQTDVNNEEIIIGNHSTITFAKGTGSVSPKYFTTGTAIRAYGGNTVTVAADANMSLIEFTFDSGEGTNAISASTGTYDDGTWTGDAASVVFTIEGTSGHRRFKTVTVTIGTAAGYTTYYTSVVNCIPSDVETIVVEQAAQKVLRDGQLFIIRGEEVYTLTGVRVQ